MAKREHETLAELVAKVAKIQPAPAPVDEELAETEAQAEHEARTEDSGRTPAQ